MAGSTEGFLKIKGISKRFGAVKALDDVSFQVRRGEIHAILGENGAGKSTLVKIIMGENSPDLGEIELEGVTIKIFSPLHARSCGIQMVHQELALFENMTVAENIFPWVQFRTRLNTVKWKKLNEEARKRLVSFGLESLDPKQPLRDLTFGAQQMTEILRCLSAEPKILLLDEPTSGLNDEEVTRLMSTLKKLRDNGETILYISHKLKEILDIADRVTIMRDGRYIVTLDNDEKLTEHMLIDSMVGRDLSSSLYSHKTIRSLGGNETLFEARHLAKKNGIRDISFQVRRGEILGLYGLEGSGTDSLSRVIFGLEERSGGEILFKGKRMDDISPEAMIANKIMYLNNNRKLAGLLLDMPTTENIAMPILRDISRFSFIGYKKLQDISETYVRKFSITIPSLRTKPRNLSGGNQQKVMLAICLAAKPELLIVNEPTRGIDVGAKAEIHKLLLSIAEQGVSIIAFTSELPELMGLSDRVLVMKKMEIAGELTGEGITESAIMTLAAKGDDHPIGGTA